MTSQEIFDKVAKHLLMQNAKSYNTSTYVCMYRSDNGKKCAIGCLIEDNEYDPYFENIGVAALGQKTFCPQSLKDRFAGHTKLLMGLQWIHDESISKNWKVRLIELAKEFNLNADILGV